MKKEVKQQNSFEEMMSGANGRLSSKRIIGGFILLVLLVVIVIDTFWGKPNTWLGEAFITMLVGAFSLFGIGVFEKRHTNDYEQKDIDEGEC